MRLFLTILRNCLPTTDIVWGVSDAELGGHFTIAKLLQRVNVTVPLEAEEWGLEDYSVESGGFECIHFMKVDSILKDGDHVLIRPLDKSDVRARHRSGRTQISSSGIHLIDGVPFGRDRGPERPIVRIPPKRMRSHEMLRGSPDEAEELDQQAEVLLLTNGLEHSSSTEEPSRKRRRLSQDSRVRFDESVLMEDDDDEEEDDDFDPESEDQTDEDVEASNEDIQDEGDGNAAIEDFKSDESSSESSEEDDDEDSDSDEDVDSSDGDDSDSDDDTSSEDSSDSSDQESEDEVPVKSQAPTKQNFKKTIDNVIKSKMVKSVSTEEEPEVCAISLPGQGKAVTQNRNERRKIAKRIKALVESGQLPQSATKEDLERYDTQQAGGVSQVDLATDSHPDGGTDPSIATTETSPFAQRRKYDLGPATRMIFGSLGVRAPKSEEEAAKISEKLRARGSRLWVTTPLESFVSPQRVAPESDAWRSNIEVYAVDCGRDVRSEEAPYPWKSKWKARPLEEVEGYVGEVGWFYEDGKDATAQVGENWENDVEIPDTDAEFEGLKAAEAKDYQPGAIVAFKLMEMTQATNFEPKISEYKVAKVIDTVDLDSIEVQYATKDSFQPLATLTVNGLGSKQTRDRMEMLLGTAENGVADEENVAVLWLPSLIQPKLIRSISAQNETDGQANEERSDTTRDENIKKAFGREVEHNRSRNTSSELSNEDSSLLGGPKDMPSLGMEVVDVATDEEDLHDDEGVSASQNSGIFNSIRNMVGDALQRSMRAVSS